MDLAEIRDRESAKAAEILGVDIRENLGFKDGFFINDEEHQLEIIKRIRKYKPEIVLCNAIDDRHIDHGKGSKLVSDACFLSGLQKSKPILMVNIKKHGDLNMCIIIFNGKILNLILL